MDEDIPVKTLHTTFRIINLLNKNGEMTFMDIVDKLNQPSSTVYDHLQSLQKLGYLEQTEDHYQVSFEFLLIGDRRRYNNELFIKSQPIVDELAEITGEHASLFIKEGGKGRTIYTKQGEKAIDFKIYDGSQSHLADTAPGKAILSKLDRYKVTEILNQQDLLQNSNNDSITQSEFYKELDNISDQGFALDDQVAIEGMRGIAVPIIDKTDCVQGAISIYGPVRRIKEDRINDSLVDILEDRKNIIELSINYVDYT